jgi:hypothetical protein
MVLVIPLLKNIFISTLKEFDALQTYFLKVPIFYFCVYGVHI